MKTLNFFKASIKKENLIFPQVIEDLETLKKLDRVIVGNKSPFVISFLFRESASNIDVNKAQDLINKGMNEERELSGDNKKLILKIVEEYKKSKEKYVIFNSVGNVIYLSEVVEELDKKDVPKIIKVTCLLWLYQNMVEVILSHLSEIFYIIAKNKRDKDFLNMYNKMFEKERHLSMGKLWDYSKKYEFTSQDKDTFLNHNELRNRLAHANCFYDSKREKVIVSSSEMLDFDDLEKEFKYVKDFLFELIHLFNNKQEFEFKKELLKMAKEYQRVGRSSRETNSLKEKLHNINKKY